MMTINRYPLTIMLLAVVLLAGCSKEVKEEEMDDSVAEIAPSVADEMDEVDDEVTTYPADDPGTISLTDIEDALTVRVIYFEYDSSSLRIAQSDVIEAHGRFLSANPDTRVVLEGHADERGSREYNLALGERRALAVQRQLVLLGASESQIRVVSYGEERPAFDGHDESAWQQNRRVEILY